MAFIGILNATHLCQKVSGIIPKIALYCKELRVLNSRGPPNMGIHTTKISMVKEALQEYIEVAKFSLDFDKSKDLRWNKARGCYGYPAALLLLSIVDSIGAEVMGGGDDVKKHFKILNHKDYFNLSLTEVEIEILRNEYRNNLSHNSHISEHVVLYPGSITEPVIKSENDTYFLNLNKFYNVTNIAVINFCK